MSKEKYMVDLDGNIKSEAEVAKIVRPRTETLEERFTRLHHDYDDGPKPAHYDNKNIVTMEKRAELKEKVSRPKPFRNDDPSSYPSNQKKTMNTWELMMETAKNPKTKEDRIEAKEVRQTIYKDWNKPKMRKYLGEDELKLIGKHPSQRKPLEVKPIVKPVAAPIVKPAVPQIPLEEQIRIHVENRKQQQMQDLENRYGRGGLMTALKDII